MTESDPHCPSFPNSILERGFHPLKSAPAFLFFLLLLSGCRAPDQAKALGQTDLGGYFESIRFEDNKLLLKLHNIGTHYARPSGAITEYGEILILPLGGSLELIDKHGGLKLTPLGGRPDQIFEAESSFNASDFGGPNTKKYYLICLVPTDGRGQNLQILEEPSKAFSSK